MNLFSRSTAPEDEQTDLSLPPLTLMAPHPVPHAAPAQVTWADDLGLEELLATLTIDRRHRTFVRGVLTNLQTDDRVIAWRQAVLGDLLRNPELTDALQGLLSSLASLGQDTAMLGRRRRSLLLETSDRLSELDLYVELVQQLHDLLTAANLESEALLALRDALAEVLQNPEYAQLREKLPALREPLQNIGSITVAINLDLDLKPQSAVLVSINQREVGEPVPLLGKLFNNIVPGEAPVAGAAPVHRFPEDYEMRKYNELFQDMNKLLQATAKPIANELRKYVKVSSRTLVLLEPELAFFIAAARMVQHGRARGIPFTAPVARLADERVTLIDDLHNVQLVLRDEKTVASTVQFDDTGRVGVLTGPNSGGKTTYLRSVGGAQILFQAGVYIPAASAQMSPVSRILTHFPRLETREQGRLAEEAERLRTLFTAMDDNSLVLLNETFSSTAFGEALYLAQDILSALCAKGVRAVFATHLVELVGRFSEIESAVSANSTLCSLVAGIQITEDGSPTPTYRVTRGEPLGRSYAQEIARKYGISLNQILDAGETS